MKPKRKKKKTDKAAENATEETKNGAPSTLPDDAAKKDVEKAGKKVDDDKTAKKITDDYTDDVIAEPKSKPGSKAKGISNKSPSPQPDKIKEKTSPGRDSEPPKSKQKK